MYFDDHLPAHFHVITADHRRADFPDGGKARHRFCRAGQEPAEAEAASRPRDFRGGPDCRWRYCGGMAVRHRNRCDVVAPDSACHAFSRLAEGARHVADLGCSGTWSDQPDGAELRGGGAGHSAHRHAGHARLRCIARSAGWHCHVDVIRRAYPAFLSFAASILDRAIRSATSPAGRSSRAASAKTPSRVSINRSSRACTQTGS